jgi:polar amino acid transport system permease protein
MAGGTGMRATDAEIKKIQSTLHPDRPPRVVVTDGAQIPRERSLFVAWWVAIIVAFVAILVLTIFIPDPYRRSLFAVFDGAETTLRITIVAIACSLVMGLLAGLGRASKNAIVNGIASLYVEIIRGIPLLVQLFWIYYALARFVKLPSFWSAVIGLTVCYGAYIGEIFRAGIQSISKGQWEAARSLGMSGGQAMRHVILPQAVRVVLPPIGNEFIALLKDSSLVSVLAISDLLRRGREFVAVNFTAFETYTLVALIYLLMTLVFSRVVFYIEKGMSIEGADEGPVSFMHRLAAHGADFIVLYVLWMLFDGIVEAVVNGIAQEVALLEAPAFAGIPAATWNYLATGTAGGAPVMLWISLGIALVCFVVYMVAFWSRTGQTPGKMAVGLRVIGPDSQCPGLRRALLRILPFLAVVVPIAIWRLFWGSLLTGDIASLYLIPWTAYLWFVVPVAALVVFFLSQRDRYGQGWHDKLAGTYVVRAT